MRIQSEAEYARSKAAISPAAQWRREAEVWFDGSVESVDRRLGLCRRLLGSAQARIGSAGFSAASLDRVAELEQQLSALTGLRRHLLTAGADRGAGKHDTDPDEPWRHTMSDEPYDSLMTDHYWGENGKGLDFADIALDGDYKGKHRAEANLSPADRRFVDLEAAKFARAHRVPLDELQTRAANFAQEATSTLPRARSRAITAAFVRKVSTLHRPPVRTAAARPSNQDFPPELMFI